jgi:hypothetical protein
MSGFATNQRINKALLMLTKALQPYVERRLREVYGEKWRYNLSLAAGADPRKPLDAYALLKTMLDNWQSVFRDGLKPVIRNHVSFALDGRNASAHAGETIADRDAIGYLLSIQAVAEAIDAKSGASFKPLIDDQTKAMAAALGVSPEVAATKAAEPSAQAAFDLGEGKYVWKPWRDVAPPHADVMAARFQEAEFAADLSTVARGDGVETYVDPREFFRVTYLTGGLRKVLIGAVERLASKGGEPVIGLQTSFGGGKTHTMLALYHLANSASPETLPGLAEIFASAVLKALPKRPKPPVVFVGTALGANQPIGVEGARTVKTLWGLIAVKLGGWKAYEAIKPSDEGRTLDPDRPTPQMSNIAQSILAELDRVRGTKKDYVDPRHRRRGGERLPRGRRKRRARQRAGFADYGLWL